MNRKVLIVIGAIVLLAFLLRSAPNGRVEQLGTSTNGVRTDEGLTRQTEEVHFNEREPSSLEVAASRESLRAKTEQRLDEQWKAPMSFYGKVVDQEGAGVADANIELTWNNLSGTALRKLTSNTDGTFKLEGEEGYVLSVRVRKSGYHTLKDNPVIFYFGEPNQRHFPIEEDPVLFRLQKMLDPEMLIQVKRNFRVPRDGTPVRLDLVSGHFVESSQDRVKVECWTEDEPSPGSRYDWKCRVTLEGGGLVLSTNEFAVIAPEGGYESHYDIVMAKDVPELWARDAHRRFFFKTANGNFGRLNFSMISGGDHFCKVESFLNPQASRNLDFNGKNAVRNPPQ